MRIGPFSALAATHIGPFQALRSLQLKLMFRTIVPRPYPPVLIAPGSHLTIIGKLHIANELNGVQQKGRRWVLRSHCLCVLLTPNRGTRFF